jgi:uncharacterized protein
MAHELKTRLSIDDIIGDKREAILEVAKRYGATNIRVFGSVARGEARPDSDIDFLVDFPPDYTLLDQAGLVAALRNLLGRHVEIANAAYLRDEMRDSILADAQPL